MDMCVHVHLCLYTCENQSTTSIIVPWNQPPHFFLILAYWYFCLDKCQISKQGRENEENEIRYLLCVCPCWNVCDGTFSGSLIISSWSLMQALRMNVSVGPVAGCEDDCECGD